MHFFPGIDYANNRIKDFANVDKYNVSLIDRDAQARMPWHDIQVKNCLQINI